jgi:hypothetical protein
VWGVPCAPAARWRARRRKSPGPLLGRSSGRSSGGAPPLQAVRAANEPAARHTAHERASWSASLACIMIRLCPHRPCMMNLMRRCCGQLGHVPLQTCALAAVSRSACERWQPFVAASCVPTNASRTISCPAPTKIHHQHRPSRQLLSSCLINALVTKPRNDNKANGIPAGLKNPRCNRAAAALFSLCHCHPEAG